MRAADRFKEFRTREKLSMRGLAEALGVTSSIVSDWESGKAEVRKPNALAIQAIYGYRWEWLMTGEEPMRLVLGTPRNIHQIPVLDGLPSCGPSGEIHELGPNADTHPFSAAFIGELLRQCGAGSAATLFAAHVQGDSMSPTIQAGDMVLVNTALALRVEPQKGALHMVRRAAGSSEARVKRVFLSTDSTHLTLNSDNRNYPPLLIPVDGVPVQDLVIGRVCWYGRTVVDQQPKPEDW
jgi:SOS-response transcriptional repressor LexA